MNGASWRRQRTKSPIKLPALLQRVDRKACSMSSLSMTELTISQGVYDSSTAFSILEIIGSLKSWPGFKAKSGLDLHEQRH